MLKKILSTLLIVSMLCTVMPITGVFAAPNNTNAVIYYEDFETGYAPDSDGVVSGVNGYVNDSNAATRVFTIKEEANGNKYMNIYDKSDTGAMSIKKSVDYTGNEFTFRIRIRSNTTYNDDGTINLSDFASNGQVFQFNFDKGSIDNKTAPSSFQQLAFKNHLIVAYGNGGSDAVNKNVVNNNTRTTVAVDNWYDVVYVSKLVNGVQRSEVYVDGVYQGYYDGWIAADANLTGLTIYQHRDKATPAHIRSYDYDDITLYKPSSAGFVSVTASDGSEIVNNAEDVNADNAFTVNFSTPVLKSGIVLKKESTTIDADVSYVDGDMTRVAVTPESLLETGTDYTLSLSGVTDVQGNVIEDTQITFTTNSIEGVMASTPVHTLVSNGIKTTFTVSNKTENEANLYAFSVTYNGDELIDIAMDKIENLAAWGNRNVVLTADIADGVYDYKVKTFLWDSTTLKPVFAPIEDSVTMRSYTTLYIAGDSIAQSSNNTPKSGWVQHLDKFFDSALRIENKAIGGQSSRSYYEGLEQNGTPAESSPWQELLAEAQPGDYVAIQFGHNDTKSQATSVGTDPNMAISAYDPANKKFPYKYYLSKFIEDATAKGVNPILVSSVSSHDSVGSYYPVPFADYAKAMVEVGEELGVPVLDINTRTAEELKTLGKVNDKIFYLILEKDAFKNFPKGETDNQHLRDYGGIYVSYLFRDELMKTNSSLKNFAFSTYSQSPSLFLYDRFNTDIVLKTDTDGTILVPVKDVAEGLGAEYQLSDNTITVTYPASIIKDAKTDADKVITATVGSNTDYKVDNVSITSPVEYAPKSIDGEIYINPFFFKDVCGSDVYYNEFMKMTTILTGVDVPVDPYVENFDNYVGSEEVRTLPNTTNWQDNTFAANASYVIAEKVGTNEDGTDNMAAVMHTSESKSSYTIDLKGLAFTSPQQLDLRVKLPTNTKTREIRLGVQNSTANSVYAQCIIFNDNGTISGLGSALSTPLTYNADEWINIRIKALVVNDPGVAPTARVRAYVVENGVEKPICGEYQIPDGKASGMVDGLRFMIRSASDEFYIDDITVSPLDFVQSEWQN